MYSSAASVVHCGSCETSLVLAAREHARPVDPEHSQSSMLGMIFDIWVQQNANTARETTLQPETQSRQCAPIRTTGHSLPALMNQHQIITKTHMFVSPTVSWLSCLTCAIDLDPQVIVCGLLNLEQAWTRRPKWRRVQQPARAVQHKHMLTAV